VRAELWFGGVYVKDGGELIPMSKPKRIPIGTSRNLLKRVVLVSILCHTSDMKGVLTMSRSCNNGALLGIMKLRTAESAPVFASCAGVLVAARDAVPGEAVDFAGFTLAFSSGALSE
jgi:hypothetical protein